jgi:cysteine desulfurase/selenocysteine lyase
VTQAPSIYLDHAATAFPKAPGVSDAVARFLDRDAGNPGRGGHLLSVAASRAIEGARAEIARLLGADPERTLLGPGATYWLSSILSARLKQGSRVLVSSLEHNAVMRPLRRLERQLGVEITVVRGAAPDAVPSVAEVAQAADETRPSLIVLTAASNVTGALLPCEEIAAAVAPVPVVVDGAQTAGSRPVDFSRSRLAAFVCSGHKGLLGPPGTGVLLLAEGFEVEPLVSGGTGSRSESEEMPTWLPDRLEAGTPNGPGIAGLGAAVAWLHQRGVETIQSHEMSLMRRLVEELADIDRVRLVGWHDGADRLAIVSFTIEGADVGQIATTLDREHGIMVRSGLHCAPAAHRRLGTFPEGTIRVGIGPFNHDNDIDAFILAVRSICSERAP